MLGKLDAYEKSKTPLEFDGEELGASRFHGQPEHSHTYVGLLRKLLEEHAPANRRRDRRDTVHLFGDMLESLKQLCKGSEAQRAYDESDVDSATSASLRARARRDARAPRSDDLGVRRDAAQGRGLPGPGREQGRRRARRQEPHREEPGRRGVRRVVVLQGARGVPRRRRRRAGRPAAGEHPQLGLRHVGRRRRRRGPTISGEGPRGRGFSEGARPRAGPLRGRRADLRRRDRRGLRGRRLPQLPPRRRLHAVAPRDAREEPEIRGRARTRPRGPRIFHPTSMGAYANGVDQMCFENSALDSSKHQPHRRRRGRAREVRSSAGITG